MRHKSEALTRAKDEFLLGLLRMRMATQPTQIGYRIGMAPSRVRTLCNRVLDDDVKFSGEAESTVRAGYWGK